MSPEFFTPPPENALQPVPSELDVVTEHSLPMAENSDEEERRQEEMERLELTAIEWMALKEVRALKSLGDTNGLDTIKNKVKQLIAEEYDEYSINVPEETLERDAARKIEEALKIARKERMAAF